MNKKNNNHICKEDRQCSCSLLALEPDEDCPVHGVGIFPPRCILCGKFISYKDKLFIKK